MTSAYTSLILAGLRQAGLQGETTVLASTEVARRLQQTGYPFTDPDPDCVQDIVSTTKGLTVHWQHSSVLPAGTIGWRDGEHLRVIAVASLILSI